jgi:hypothetical protein
VGENEGTSEGGQRDNTVGVGGVRGPYDRMSAAWRRHMAQVWVLLLSCSIFQQKLCVPRDLKYTPSIVMGFSARMAQTL